MPDSPREPRVEWPLDASDDYYEGARIVLTQLCSDFEAEALRLYQSDRDGSDWQEAHRRVAALLREVSSP